MVHAMQERKVVHRAKSERDSHIKHSTSNVEIEELMAPFCKLVSYMARYFVTHLEEQAHCYECMFVFSRNTDTTGHSAVIDTIKMLKHSIDGGRLWYFFHLVNMWL